MRERGFTLIELMVALAIIVVILGAALSSQSSFNRTLVLANTAYDLGLTVRYVETYGIGTRVTTTNPNVGYGLHFDAGTPGSFAMFADSAPAWGGSCHTSPSTIVGAPDAVPGDCAYNAPGAPDGPPVATYNLNNGITIANFCAQSFSGTSCETGTTPAISTLDITFARPNPTAYFALNGTYAPSVSHACVALRSPSGSLRYVEIEQTGVINPNAASCP